MPKINFNVPFTNETGETIRRPAFDKTKTKAGANGTLQQQVIMDAENNVVMEDVQVRDMLIQILSNAYQGDEALPFADRVKRGKLARKVATSNEANYRTEELTIIQDLSAKSGSTTFLAQLDDLINGEDKVETEAA